jgi:putative transposase
MIRFALKKGLRFLENQNTWTLIKQLPTKLFLLEDDKGALKTQSMQEIFEDWRTRKTRIDEASLDAGSNVFYLATPRDMSSYRDDQKSGAMMKQAYLMAIQTRFHARGEPVCFTLAKIHPMLKEIAEEREEKAPSFSSAKRWWRQYRATQCPTKLVDRRSRSGRKKYSIFTTIFESALSTVFLTRQKEQGKEVVEFMRGEVQRINTGVAPHDQIKCPSAPTIYRWLADLHKYLVARGRLGEKAAKAQFRVALKTLKVKAILDRLEIDHTPLDGFVIDTMTKVALGRPWLTLCYEKYSKSIMGFYISFRAPSSYSTLMCLRQSMLPKDHMLARFGIKGEWPCHGIPLLVAADNGMDLHSEAVEAACLEMGITILFCGAKKPWHKGGIERLNRTIQENLIHRLPGTTFHNSDDRGDYPSEEIAAIDMETLVHLITKWIVEDYMMRPRKGLGGLTSLQSWKKGASDRVIELPAYIDQMEVIVGIPERRTCFHYGLEVEGIRYNSPELQLIAHELGGTPQMELKTYDQDVSYVDVFDRRIEGYIRVPAADQDYTRGMTRHMNQVIRAKARVQFGANYSNPDLLRTKQELQQIIAGAIRDKKLYNRKKAAVFSANDSEAVFNQSVADAEAAYGQAAAAASSGTSKAKSKPNKASPQKPDQGDEDDWDDDIEGFETESDEEVPA